MNSTPPVSPSRSNTRGGVATPNSNPDRIPSYFFLLYSSSFFFPFFFSHFFNSLYPFTFFLFFFFHLPRRGHTQRHFSFLAQTFFPERRRAIHSPKSDIIHIRVRARTQPEKKDWEKDEMTGETSGGRGKKKKKKKKKYEERISIWLYRTEYIITRVCIYIYIYVYTTRKSLKHSPHLRRKSIRNANVTPYRRRRRVFSAFFVLFFEDFYLFFFLNHGIASGSTENSSCRVITVNINNAIGCPPHSSLGTPPPPPFIKTKDEIEASLKNTV